MNDENAAALLREARDVKVAEIIIPAYILTVVVAVIGIIPNCITVVFYGFKTKTKSSTTTLITVLAVCDLIVSVFVFMFLADFSNIYYSRAHSCKIGHFIIHLVVFQSIGILWLISVNRYHRMCSAADWQAKTTKIAILCVFIVTLLASVSDLWLVDAAKINITVSNVSAIGNYCTHSDDPDLQTPIVLFHVIDILLGVFAGCTFAFTYGRIWWKARKSNIEGSRENSGGVKSSAQTMFKLEKEMSKMMAIVSIGYVVCFSPYVLATIMLINTDNKELRLEAWVRMLLRTPVLNSIINPSIYFLSNTSYRQYVKDLLFCNCLKKKTADQSVIEPHGVQEQTTEACSLELI